MKKIAISLLAAAICCSSAYAGSREQAKQIHDRIAGVPADTVLLDQMQLLIEGGDAIGAAELAIEHPDFYSTTLKTIITPWTNEAQTAFAPLNDYTATMIGAIRDNLDFRTLLYDDILYVGRASLGLPAYSQNNNNHYEQMEQSGVDLKADLVAVTQSSVNGLPAAATAGIMTSRAAAQAFFVDGTNRAMLRFTILNHLCNDLEQIKDNTRSPDRIRQDASRSPGGDSRIFINACLGCHAGMDPLAQAYAYYNYVYDSGTDPDARNGRLEYTANSVQPKYLINASNFPYGYATPNDNWANYWRAGANSLLGWDTNNLGLPDNGTGAKSLGRELANSEAFARCQVKKVFKNICFRDPENSADHNKIDQITESFKTNNYNLKTVFAESAVYCMGE
ncbi:MAG: hypothetical protein L3J62_02660 [Gammaproteobacteria bacterium]|nr:hypothetical protein [Gammaproteobacteria bacterium]MCF6229686.1 hypothetical protein [Gammaproteobacteria bacterium]